MTKKTTIIRFSFLVIISILIWTINTSNNAGQANFTNCANCHTTASSKTTVDSIVLTEALTGSVATKYVPGRLYNIAIYGRNKNALNRFGFQVKNKMPKQPHHYGNKIEPSIHQQVLVSFLVLNGLLQSQVQAMQISMHISMLSMVTPQTKEMKLVLFSTTLFLKTHLQMVILLVSKLKLLSV
jgi:hypothetical protein